MGQKQDKCVEIMGRLFGPASAQLVKMMRGNEDEIITHCRQKTLALLGPEKAKEFDNI